MFVCDLFADVDGNPTAISSASLLIFADCLLKGQQSFLRLTGVRQIISAESKLLCNFIMNSHFLIRSHY